MSGKLLVRSAPLASGTFIVLRLMPVLPRCTVARAGYVTRYHATVAAGAEAPDQRRNVSVVGFVIWPLICAAMGTSLSTFTLKVRKLFARSTAGTIAAFEEL